MLVRLTALRDRLRQSLFFVPMLFVVGSVLLGQVMLLLDARVDSLPSRLTATVDSAREVLSTVAGATLAFAGIAFSVSLLLISLASSQYSPRVVHGLFRDPLNKRVMGVVVGTFTYCLVVLRAVRGPLEGGGDAVVPSVSVLLAVVLGVVSVLSIIGFISHNAHSMDVSQILHAVTEESLDQIRSTWVASADDAQDEPSAHEPHDAPDGEGHTVTFARHGWVQQVDQQALLSALVPGGCAELHTAAGRYAIPETPLCTIWPSPSHPEEVAEVVRAAVVIGPTRTMQQDVAYGVRQLADVALKALSPGVNDPTTAQDAMFHCGAVIQELLTREPPSPVASGDEGRTLLRPQEITHVEVIGVAFDEVRLAAIGQPSVQVYLLEILELLTVALGHDGEVCDELRRQAGLVLDSVTLADLPAADAARVREAHRKRFA